MPIDAGVLKEFVIKHLFLELAFGNEIVVGHCFLFSLLGSGCVTHFAFENLTVLLQNFLDQSAFADARWSYNDQRFILKRSWVEWVEVFFGVDKHIIWLLQKHT